MNGSSILTYFSHVVMSKPIAMRKAIGMLCLSVRYANIHPIIDETKLFYLPYVTQTL